MRHATYRRCWCLAASLVWLAGCSGDHPVADATKGEQAVRTAFESWQKGDSPDALQKARPPIYLNDPEWLAGNRLLEFEIVEPLTPFGRQLRCGVKLSLENVKSGAKYQKHIGYQVETTPAFVIAREGL